MSDNGLNETERETMVVLDGAVDEKTIANRADRWIKNAIENRAFYKAGNPSLVGLTAFIVAAGPSLKKNAAALRSVGGRGVVLCVDAAFRYLLEQGVTPEYCMSIDADERMVTMIEGADTSRTTLIAMASSSPALVAAWKGPKFFVRCIGGRFDIDDKLIAVAREVVATKDIKAGDVLHPLEDVRVDFAGLSVRVVTGGNVTGALHNFAIDQLRAKRVVFVGADYSWTEAEEFYAGGAHDALAKERQEAEKAFTHAAAADGTNVLTNFSMFRFKDWHEEYVHHHPEAEVVNATEGGILGIGRDGLPRHGWTHMPLEQAIAQYAPLKLAEGGFIDKPVAALMGEGGGCVGPIMPHAAVAA